MAFFHHNFSIHLESTLVPLLGTSFNTISHFSDNLTRVYLPNTLQHSRYIYQRDRLSPRFPTYTIQPVSGPNIVSMENNPNWLLLLIQLLIDLILPLVHGQNSNTAIILMSNWLIYLVILQTHLLLIKPLILILIQEELKLTFLTLSVLLLRMFKRVVLANITPPLGSSSVEKSYMLFWSFLKIFLELLFCILKIFLILLYILFLIESLPSNKTSFTTFHSSWPWIWTGNIKVAFAYW